MDGIAQATVIHHSKHHVVCSSLPSECWDEFFVPQDRLTELAFVLVMRNNPPSHMSCDWLRDPLALGLRMHSLKVYQTMEEINERNSSSGN